VVLIDTNVLLDVALADPVWSEWSQHQLNSLGLRDRLAINAVVYAELSVAYATIEGLDAMLAATRLAVAEIPRPALYLAGRVFLAYRREGGSRTGVLPDFFIGAHAAVTGAHLVTRDAAPYRRYFPTVAVIAPQAH
jgi:hypothetical protein